MTPEPPRRLGRGLDALLARKEPAKPAAAAGAAAGSAGVAAQATAPAAPPAVEEVNEAGALRTLKLSDIRPNPYQPRKEFRPDELADLESSLRTNGLLQPITVRPAPNGSGYELIAGERRYRAATRIALDAPRTWQVGNASINRLLHGDDGFTLVGWSDDLHLAAPALDEGTA